MNNYTTDEWAKQLAFEMWGNLDFENIKVVRVQENVHEFHLPIFSNCISWRDEFDSDVEDLLEVEKVKLERILDPLNFEYTWLGYGKQTSTLILGKTYSIERIHT